MAVLDANNERRTAEVKAEVIKGIWRNALDAERLKKTLEWQRE